MKKSEILAVFGGALLAGSIATGQSTNSQKQQAPPQNLEERTQLTQQEINFRGIINDLLISDVVQAHVNVSYPTSTYLKQIQGELEFRMNSNKSQAREKLLESFAYPHRLCLALAMRYGSNEIPEQEYSDLGRKIVGLEQTISTLAQESYVDYLDIRVYEQVKEWGKLKTYEFQKLYLASKELESKEIFQGDLSEKENRIEYLKQLYQIAFTPKRYATEIVQKEDLISKNIENALFLTIEKGPIHQATIKNEVHEINESARKIRYGIYYGYFEGKPTLPHQIR